MGSFFIDLLNAIIRGLGALLNGLVSLLPVSPFQLVSNDSVSEYLGFIAWVIPINQIVAILQLWIVAVISFYLVMIILRWIKMI